ncbi:MAG: hypothetical protein K9N06_08735 [Candidatus Cloacimonetes bacterium]|nr:hypothetical protein [Candidatus Cloacimonadota bacterium]
MYKDVISSFSFLPVIAGYAELHYHLRFLYPAYFRREPEIIADLPQRLDLFTNSSLPLLLIIKDADRFPIILEKVKVYLRAGELQTEQEYTFSQKINTSWFSKICQLDISSFPMETEVFIDVEITFSLKGRKKVVRNDNFPGISQKPFRTWLAKKAINIPENWWAGDPHYHSNFTSDQVEFGADIAATREMALAQGLSWFCVTDHSYDLDDMPDSFTSNDPELKKWKNMQRECQELDSEKCRIIPGEEVSIGNSQGQNVHLLALNHKEFISGSGDSAEVWFRNTPQHQLCEIKEISGKENLFIAAHPLEKVPLAQRVTLNRGNWSLADNESSGVYIWQLINSAETKVIDKAMKTWVQHLLNRERIFICAGNDAHGNFNIMRQISFPFLKLWETHKQIFGNWLTIYQAENNEPLPALRQGRMIVSNGPFLSFVLNRLEEKWLLGETCPLRHATVEYEVRTTPEFGEIETIYCYRGDCETGKEFQFPVACPVNIALPRNGYIRMSLITTKGFLAFTNPIFTVQS